ncbi:hypothetical protein [Niveibacterium terrae]|uniref:hypothetical protein n=1 Tax=Niveibacterium terrae TaxID=3373598 RepID=UPI003A92AC8E
MNANLLLPALLLLNPLVTLAQITPLAQPQIRFCPEPPANKAAARPACTEGESALDHLEKSKRNFVREKLFAIQAQSSRTDIEQLLGSPPAHIGGIHDFGYAGHTFQTNAITWWGGDHADLALMQRLDVDGSVRFLFINGLLVSALFNLGSAGYLDIKYSQTPCVMNCKSAPSHPDQSGPAQTR